MHLRFLVGEQITQALQDGHDQDVADRQCGQCHANHEKFCAEGIRVAYECFKCLGYEDDNIIIILKHIPEHYKSGHDQAIIDFYHKLGILYYCPSRYVFFLPRASIAEAVLRMTLLLLLTNFYHIFKVPTKFVKSVNFL